MALLTFKIYVRIFISISVGLIVSLVVKCQSMSLLITYTKQCINYISLIQDFSIAGKKEFIIKTLLWTKLLYELLI